MVFVCMLCSLVAEKHFLSAWWENTVIWIFDFYPKKKEEKLNLCLSSAKLWLALCMENELSKPADSLII